MYLLYPARLRRTYFFRILSVCVGRVSETELRGVRSCRVGGSPGLVLRIADAEGGKLPAFFLQVDFSFAVGGEDEHAFCIADALIAEDLAEEGFVEAGKVDVFGVEFKILLN